MNFPNDPYMLLSVINMKLRDFYDSLDSLCDDMNIQKYELCEKLAEIGYEYNPQRNSFANKKE